MMKLGSTQSILNLSRNYAKAMGRSGLPENPDNHTTSPGAIKCDLVFTMVLIGLRLASQVYCEAGKSSGYNYQMDSIAQTGAI
jgi:hypothetical protein